MTVKNFAPPTKPDLPTNRRFASFRAIGALILREMATSYGRSPGGYIWAILEPVEEDYRPTPPDRPSHTVLLTNLANRVQPLIRYDLGDSVVARPDPCECGNPLPAIRVAGRHDDVLYLDDAGGRAVGVLPLAITAPIDDAPGLDRCQLVQTGPAVLRIRLQTAPGAAADVVWQDVEAKLAGFLAGQGLANVELVRAGEAPEQRGRSGKFHQVIALKRPAGRR